MHEISCLYNTPFLYKIRMKSYAFREVSTLIYQCAQDLSPTNVNPFCGMIAFNS